jgi:dipeptidyl aminopeptidase/acylaminoacyl peptidase
MTRTFRADRAAAVALMLLVLSPSLAAAAQKLPISHESLFLMKRVGAPSVSPDGRWVVVSVIDPAYDEKDQSSDLWLVAVDGSGQPRRLTFTKGSESDVTWSPDSRRLAFAAKREGDDVPQVYILGVAEGGEAMRVTSVVSGGRRPRWRSDGGAILFQSAVYPGAADDEANKKTASERKERKAHVRIYDSFPIRRWDTWLDDRQTHLFVQSLEAGAKAKDLLAGAPLIAGPGFAARGGEGSGDDLEPVWTPDGQSIVFVATTRRNEAAYANVNTHLFEVAAAGGEPKQLTSGTKSYSNPRFRPDGKALYFIATDEEGKVYALDRLAMTAWPWSGEPATITSSFDRSVGSWAFTPDSQTIYLTAEDAGLEKLYVMPARGGEVSLSVAPDHGVYTALVIPEKAASPLLVANWGSSINPAEVVAIDPIAHQHRLLTRFALEQAAAIDWTPPRHFWFTSSRGRKIHNMIVLPPGFDESKKYPLFVLIHGGAANMWRDQISLRWNYHLLARAGYVMLMTNYTGSTGFGEKFSQDIAGDPLRGPGSELNEAADEAIKRFPFIDASRQAAGGASYGGHLANWLEATTTRYKCLISHAGLINLESQWGTSDTIYGRELTAGGPPWEQGKVWREQNPIRYAASFKTPMLLSVGENDFRVPINETLENWSVLQRMRVPSRLLVWQGENHWILNPENSRVFYREVENWLARWVR